MPLFPLFRDAHSGGCRLGRVAAIALGAGHSHFIRGARAIIGTEPARHEGAATAQTFPVPCEVRLALNDVRRHLASREQMYACIV